MTRQSQVVTTKVKKTVSFSDEDPEIIVNEADGLSSSEHEAVFYDATELSRIRRAIQMAVRIKNDDECFRGLETLTNTSTATTRCERRYQFVDDFLALQMQLEGAKPEEQEEALRNFVVGHSAASQLESRKLAKLDEQEAKNVYKQDNISYQGKKKAKKSLFMKAFSRPSFRPMRSKISLSVNRMS